MKIEDAKSITEYVKLNLQYSYLVDSFEIESLQKIFISAMIYNLKLKVF